MRRVFSVAAAASSCVLVSSSAVAPAFALEAALRPSAAAVTAAFPVAARSHLALQFRLASSEVAHMNAVAEANEDAENSGNSDDSGALSSDVADSADDGFDYVEASCQEIHDLTTSMVCHLRDLGGPRRAYDVRGSDKIDGNASQRRGTHYRYGTVGAAVEGQQRFADDFSRLMQHLTQKPFNRIHSSSTKYANNRHQYLRKVRHSASHVVPIKAWEATDYPQYFSHAPHEAARLRSDIPSFVVENARALRDDKTMNNLKILSCRNHEFRLQLEKHLYTLINRAPKVRTTHMNRTSGISKPFEE